MSHGYIPPELRLHILGLARQLAFHDRILRFEKRYAARSLWTYRDPDGSVCLNGDDRCRFSTYVSEGPLGGTRVFFTAYHCACRESFMGWNTYPSDPSEGVWRGNWSRNNIPCNTCRPRLTPCEQLARHFTRAVGMTLDLNLILWVLLAIF